MRLGKIEAVNKAIDYGGKRHYRGVAPYPYTPAKGDTWEELDNSDNWIESWFWNGNYWLSSQLYEFSACNTLSSVFSSTSLAFRYPVDSNYNIFIIQLLTRVILNGASTATNYWRFFVSYTTTLFTVSIAEHNSILVPANSERLIVTGVNLHFDVLSLQILGLRIGETRTGGTVQRQSTTKVEYRKARR